MKINHHRRSIRLREFDYASEGAYFITLCTWHQECTFGTIVDDQMQLNEYGKIAMKCWHDLPAHYECIKLDEMVIMPNHMHGIIIDVGAGFKPAPTKRHGLSEYVRALKTFSARKINNCRNHPGCPVWQRNYYERVVRNENELHEIREYIINNPLKWELDENHPDALIHRAGFKPAHTGVDG